MEGAKPPRAKQWERDSTPAEARHPAWQWAPILSVTRLWTLQLARKLPVIGEGPGISTPIKGGKMGSWNVFTFIMWALERSSRHWTTLSKVLKRSSQGYNCGLNHILFLFQSFMPCTPWWSLWMILLAVSCEHWVMAFCGPKKQPAACHWKVRHELHPHRWLAVATTPHRKVGTIPFVSPWF